jgi:hypothetical protein
MSLREDHNMEVVHQLQGVIGKDRSTLLQNLFVGEQGYNILGRRAVNEHSL